MELVIKMRKRIILLVLICLSIFNLFAENINKEIDYLLKHIKDSNLIFIRNGSEYSSEDAYKHILGKYKYFKKDIDSAEKFIELTATKSMMSGKHYLIKTSEDKIVQSKDYLLAVLAEYRKNIKHSTNKLDNLKE